MTSAYSFFLWACYLSGNDSQSATTSRVADAGADVTHALNATKIADELSRSENPQDPLSLIRALSFRTESSTVDSSRSA